MTRGAQLKAVAVLLMVLVGITAGAAAAFGVLPAAAPAASAVLASALVVIKAVAVIAGARSFRGRAAGIE